MKMRDVCVATGLTDRTVRYYIECGLVFPNNKENYDGRRNFSFTLRDIERLEQIKALRTAGFSIEQIKAMQETSDVRDIVKTRLADIITEHSCTAQVITALQKADIDRTVSAEELAVILSACNPTPDNTIPDKHPPRRKLAAWKRAVWIMFIAVFGILSFITALVSMFNDSQWISFGDGYLLLLDLAGILSIGMLIARRWSIPAVTAVVLCFALVMTNLGCMVYNAPEELTDATYRRVADIAWDDETVLESLGFEYFPEVDFWRYTEGDKNSARLDITVQRLHINEYNYLDVIPVYMEWHEGMAVQSHSFVKYDNVFNRWICHPQSVTYDYTFYTSPVTIEVYETHEDGSTHLMFAEFVDNIVA